MPQECLLEAKGLSRRFGQRVAVSDLDLALHRGEIVGLLGPNGAGKSTTMRMLCGTLPPQAGTVSIDDIDLLRQPRQAKRRMGYLPEQPPLYPDMTVQGFLAFAARLHGVASASVREYVDFALQRCDLGEVRDRRIGNLSKGFRQRVGIAQALVHQPSVIILDEPTVGLDPVQTQAVRDLLDGLRADHAILFSSHMLAEVQAVCDRVVMLVAGQVVHETELNRVDLSDYLLRAEAPDMVADLATVPGVATVTRQAGGFFRLGLVEPPARVLTAIVAARWRVSVWQPARTNLEEVFLAHTQRKEVA